MRRGLAVLLFFVVVATMTLSSCDDGGHTTTPIPKPPSPYDWTAQESGTTVDLFDVFFVNAITGWAVGEKQVLLATTSGGESWTQPPKTPPTGGGTEPNPVEPVQRLNSVFFFDNETGWAVGGSEELPATGEVYKTKTSGAYPVLQTSAAVPFYTVFFLDRDKGWAAGGLSTLHQTVDGGATWSVSKIAESIAVLDLHFLTLKMGWASTENGGIYRTNDGTNWERETTDVIGAVRAIQFIDTLNAWACGDGPAYLRRELNVSNKPVWTRIDIAEFPGKWSDLFFLDKQTGWIVGSGGNIYKTENGGRTWRQETILTSNNLLAIHMVDKTHGFVVGENGVVFTYTPRN